ncbi:hypothetical protein JW721_05720 [Candidatus Micrarchaeota archaeon]|nr:hypothetical protein [Candidatus Micrarchaeota archaeon]
MEVEDLKKVLLKGKNIDILLYLAEYSPKASRADITERFGKPALSGLKELKRLRLVEEENGFLQLTSKGIFQVEGLMAMVG